MTDYNEMNAQLRALIQGVPHYIANLANASALIFNTLEDINWAGFYFAENEKIILGPFQGKPACIEIPVGKGVCGAAVRQGTTMLDKDVHEFPGHIACDSASNSEIVIPLRVQGKIIGVLDVDSPSVGRFTETDRAGLEEFVHILSEALENARNKPFNLYSYIRSI
ncbi:MAG TPA: GAF domain-containing protein [Oscillospiraceae bacterium]|nr:GAF domain-containing protein [Oscillospiraceae bacterium]HPS34351.1 GAF domain-containing protein [Oscillospiraceae bacterium]